MTLCTASIEAFGAVYVDGAEFRDNQMLLLIACPNPEELRFVADNRKLRKPKDRWWAYAGDAFHRECDIVLRINGRSDQVFVGSKGLPKFIGALTATLENLKQV